MLRRIAVTQRRFSKNQDSPTKSPETFVPTSTCDRAQCRTLGDPHFTAFSGAHFDFFGIGRYSMAQGEGLDISIDLFLNISAHPDGRTPRTRVGLKARKDASHPRPFRRCPSDPIRAPRRPPSACPEKV